MKRSHPFAIALGAVFLGFSVLTMIPDTADAKRMGGGNSIGSRGSRTAIAPKQSLPRESFDRSSSTSGSRQPMGSMASGSPAGGLFKGGLGSGLLGGLGGFMLGGMLGSMLFGHGGAGMAGGAGGGIGLLELLLIGGVAWFAWRWFKRQQSGNSPGYSGLEPLPSPTSSRSHYNAAPHPQNDGAPLQREGFGHGLPQTFQIGGTAGQGAPMDEVSQGLEHIATMDPNFSEERFLAGARLAYQQMQKAWCDGSLDNLKPLLTPAMAMRIQSDLQARQHPNHQDVIENIQFQKVQISEAWQESGDDWITVWFQVAMLEYSLDAHGTVIDGNRQIPVTVEEYWTFTRKVGSRDPNWQLSAIQQPDQPLVA
ncbi:MAG: Tim44 domain-containing protein [Magnetococcales bacterium]|nr:Tim44 domain-containing protein [Magnetococcales bacterium]